MTTLLVRICLFVIYLASSRITVTASQIAINTFAQAVREATDHLTWEGENRFDFANDQLEIKISKGAVFALGSFATQGAMGGRLD